MAVFFSGPAVDFEEGSDISIALGAELHHGGVVQLPWEILVAQLRWGRPFVPETYPRIQGRQPPARIGLTTPRMSAGRRNAGTDNSIDADGLAPGRTARSGASAPVVLWPDVRRPTSGEKMRPVHFLATAVESRGMPPPRTTCIGLRTNTAVPPLRLRWPPRRPKRHAIL